MEQECKKEPINYNIGPKYLFQDPGDHVANHQIGQISWEGTLYRPRLLRVVVNNRGTGRGYRNPQEHTHNVFHIIIPREGKAAIKHSGQVETIEKGTFLVISPGEPHCFMTNLNHCVFTAITFEYCHPETKGEYTGSFVELLTELTGKRLKHIGNRYQIPDFALENIHQLTFDIAREAEETSVRSAFLLIQLLLDIVSWQMEKEIQHFPDSRLEVVYAAIRKRYREPLAIDSLAQEAGISRRSLTRRFRERFGVTIKQLQLRFRLDAAKLMLQTTNMQVQEIAEEVGYMNLYQFTAAFKKGQGVSPSVFRKSP